MAMMAQMGRYCGLGAQCESQTAGYTIAADCSYVAL